MIETLKEVREALRESLTVLEANGPRFGHLAQVNSRVALTKLDALIAQVEKAEPVAKKDAYAIACQAEADALRAENERLQAQTNERGALAIANGIRMERAEAENERLECSRDDARFALRKLREQIQGDCV